VDAQTARQLNREDVTVNTSLNLWMILAISIGILSLLIIGYLIYKQQQLKQQLQRESKRRKILNSKYKGILLLTTVVT